jgi:hypothetical protein
MIAVQPLIFLVKSSFWAQSSRALDTAGYGHMSAITTATRNVRMAPSLQLLEERLAIHAVR